jgi:hypothetical protein
MAFINKEDYATIINDNILDEVTEIDDDKIDACEVQAIEFMAGFLNSRYDVDAIFNKTGSERNPIILRYAMAITIFYLHRIQNFSKTPSWRVDDYNEAKVWLEKVSELRINPRELPLLPDGSKDYVQYGSNPQRNNHI